MDTPDYIELAASIKRWGVELGFAQVGIATTELDTDETHLLNWLAQGRHGEMDYMARHGTKRSRPADLHAGTMRVISARLDYDPPGARNGWEVIEDPELGFVSRYALGRDYHKLMRSRLQKLADRMTGAIGPFGYRAFSDSAPVLEKALARNAGLGWIGKHTNLINRRAGSWFFLGELYTDLPLPADKAESDHCGTCVRCIEVCPWNKFAKKSVEPDFAVRHGLDGAALVDLFGWSEAEFLARTEGSAIRRIGHEQWLRNIAVALGNAPHAPAIVESLKLRMDHPSALVREHVAWALERQDPQRLA